jgi:hypothetical protein
LGPSDPQRSRQWPWTRPDELLDLAEASVDARLYLSTATEDIEVLFDFGNDILAGFVNLAPLVDSLDYLPRPKCNEHAKDNDADLAGKCSPSVQRLWNMDMHGENLRAVTEA